ncbi:MAG: BRCT domain-containing protein [Pseudooceanicola sp.]|nr:BRCT domain-containing protein [Pseudooceanicola sp.]
MKKKISYESKVLFSIHERMNTAKNECFFVGFIDGVLANARVDTTELEPLLAECVAICRQVGDEDAAEIVMEASAGHENTPAELLQLLTLIAEVRSARIDADCPRSAANRLLGFCAGVNCDAIITTREARALLDRMEMEHDLQGDPRIEALRHVLVDSLQNEEIDPGESQEISHLITALVGDSYADTGIPSSEAIPVIQDLDEIDESTLEGSNIVLTGGFAFGSRAKVSLRLEDLGACVQASPSRKTDIVIIGTDGSPHYTHKHHGGKLAKVFKLRASGPAPRIYVEAQLHSLLS